MLRNITIMLTTAVFMIFLCWDDKKSKANTPQWCVFPPQAASRCKRSQSLMIPVSTLMHVPWITLGGRGHMGRGGSLVRGGAGVYIPPAHLGTQVRCPINNSNTRTNLHQTPAHFYCLAFSPPVISPLTHFLSLLYPGKKEKVAPIQSRPPTH